MNSLPDTKSTSFFRLFATTFTAVIRWFITHLPLLAVISIALVVSLQNIHPSKTYTGWDNVHGEFDLVDYTKQVVGGAWSEHQGLGAPSAQGQLSEVPRLPWLWLLSAVLPTNMIRYAYIFITYTLGGITMYLYLKKIWFKHQPNWLAAQLAAIGGILYLLHMLTLQQFYISFEMFMAQFAFLPLLLLVVHRFEKKLTVKTLLIFFAVQFLIAPSAHTPTVFYLGVLVSQLYGFFITLKQGFFTALWKAFLIGFLSFVASAYFIIPNLYYSVENAHYVAESRDNELFASESLASVREAANISNFLRSTHYLFTWRDYSFADKEFSFIFDEWRIHLNSLGVQVVLHFIGIFTVIGAVAAGFNRKLGAKRWAILAVFVGCILFIWMGMFPFQGFFDWLYQSSIIRETFRNPFTKLSIIYSVVAVIVFTSFWEWLLGSLAKFKPSWLVGSVIAVVLTFFSGLIAYSALPAFDSQFLSEKLQAEYPTQYEEMYAFLKSRSDYDRILALPQTSHAGWEYYDWQFLGEGNGYQGLGFYFFGVDQPVLHRDSDRWVETSDFFYHELKYALDRQDTEHFNQLLAKYQIDIIIIDDTKVEPTFSKGSNTDHQLVLDAGLQEIWNKDFLSVYQKPTSTVENIYAPATITKITADTDRTRYDFAFQEYQGYLTENNNQASVLFPFANLMTKSLNNITFKDNTTTITTELAEGEYDLVLPTLDTNTFTTPVAISFNNKKVEISFPQNSLTFGDQTIQLSSIAGTSFNLESNPKQVIVFFNETGFIVSAGETITPILNLEPNLPISVEYAIQPTTERVDNNRVDSSSLEYIEVTEIEPNWSQLNQPLSITRNNASQISFTSTFPRQQIDLLQNPSVNCAQPKRGTIDTLEQDGKIIYQADSYAVNCNGYTFSYPITSYGQLLAVSGTAEKGRGTKMFVNFDDDQIISEDFLFQDRSFSKILSLPTFTSESGVTATVNWETRSFGKLSQNSLHDLSLTAFPSNRLAQLQLLKSDISATQNNVLEIKNTNSWLSAFFTTEVSCETDPCYIALDQSFDILWLAFDTQNWKQLQHHRLNNWANAWLVEPGTTTLFIFYVPELLSLVSMGILVALIVILSALLVFKNKKK